MDPRISDWIAYLELNHQLHWVRLYGAVTWSLQGDVLTVSGSGLPLACKPIPRWRRFLASRLSRKPVPQLVHQHLSTLFETTLCCDFGQRKVTAQSAFPSSRSILRRGSLEESLCPTSP